MRWSKLYPEQERQTERQTDRQTDRQTEYQTLHPEPENEVRTKLP